MSGSIDTLLGALQNGVTALNSIKVAINNVFPRTTASSTTATTGSLTFSSSQPALFMVVQSSSGGTYKIPLYNQ